MRREPDELRADEAPVLLRIPPAVWVVVFLLLVGALAAACAPRVPPPVFGEAPPPIEEPATSEWTPHPDDTLPACVVTSYTPKTPALGCRGVVVPESDYAALLTYETTCPYWEAGWRGERVERLLDWGRCEDVAGSRWLYGEELRRDLRTAKWTAIGLGVGGLVVGAIVGVSAGEVREVVGTVGPWTLRVRFDARGFALGFGP